MSYGTYFSPRGTYGSKGGGSTSTLGQMTEETKAANKKRETEIRKILDDVIGMYQPGGQFGKGTEAMLESQKKKDISSATQSLVSSGLYGSTMTAGLPSKWESEVGMPARAKLEDIRYGALTESMRQKAGFVERIEDMYPDYGMFAQLYAQRG